MPKKISLEISDETYKGISNLANFFGQDEKQVIKTILQEISNNNSHLEWLSTQCRY
ncbi:MAG: hypothetical protein NWE98_09315 [Candidatus Bathyarchaeota archaeon]|nr:hypothetical protein [Candidatus Bathyarchaeota archaeon]